MTRRRRWGLWIAALLTIAVMIGAWFLWSARRARLDADSKTAATCSPLSCHTLKCAAGMHARVDSDLCCRECVPNPPSAAITAGHDLCDREKCAPCGDLARAEPVEGECCPRCVPLDGAACKAGKALYDTRRTVLEAELRACNVDGDCMVASFGDACSASCPTPLNKQKLGPVVAHLREEAEVYCEKCPTPAFACQYPDATEAKCSNGRCEFNGPAPKR